jgi:hypothetical protein
MTMTRIVLAIAAGLALIFFDMPAGHAQYSGDARWCAVVSIGTGSVHWDCSYDTVEACVPNVLAGNRGFCGLNPYYSATQRAQAWAHPAYRPRHHAHSHKYSRQY